MLRVEDDLYQRVFETAHDARVSMNAYIVGTMHEKTTSSVRKMPALESNFDEVQP